MIPFPRGTRSVESYDWPMFHRDVGHTGVADLIVTAPDTNATAWTFPTAYDIEASAAIVGDMVYFANKYGNVDEDCMIFGVNESTGIYWNFTDGDYGGSNSFRSGPALADVSGFGHMLFMGSIGMGATPDFAYGLDATPDDNGDGIIDDQDNDEGLDDPPDSNYDLIWRSKLADYTSNSNPIVEYISALGTHVMYVVGGETLHAIDAVDGDFIWNFTTGGYIGTSPALGYDVLGNPVVYIASDDGILYAFDARGAGGTTTIEWQYPIGGMIDSSPTVADDRIFIGSYTHNTLICLDATPDDNGDTLITEIEDEGINDPASAQYDLIWEYDLGDSVQSTAAVHDGVVFITTYDGYIYALEESPTSPITTIIWNYFTGDSLGSSSPVVADGKVFVGSKNTKKVLALDEVGGGGTTTLIWEYETGDYIYATPAVANGKLYIGSMDGTFYVFGQGGSINKKPYPPELYSPLNTETVRTSTPRFDFSESVDADGYVVSYEIEIDDDSDFSSPEYFLMDFSLSHYFPSYIADGTYYWHVRAKDDQDAYSIWSEAWQVKVDTVNDDPIVSVVSPNGGENWAGAHDIHWNAYDPDSESLEFELWLSDDAGSSYNTLLASNINSHVREWRLDTTLFPDGENYRVKVIALDSRGKTTEDSSDDDFKIDNAGGVVYDDWPQFHHHKNNTGVSPSQGPETNNTNWIFDTSREIDVSPALFDGKVFVGDHNGSFIALQEETGEVVWRYDHTDVWSWCDTSPAVGYSPFFGRYVAFFGLSITDGYNFFAMDINGLTDGDQGITEGTLPPNYNFNGDVLWAYKAVGTGALSSSPTVHNETVYIGFFETDLGDDNASLWAFDINGYTDGDDGIPDDNLDPEFRNSDVLWKFDTQSMAVTSTPAVESIPGLGDVVFVGTDEGYWSSDSANPNFFALDADPFDDGSDQGMIDPLGAQYDMIWEVDLDDYIFSSPAVSNGRVFIGTYSSEMYDPGNGGQLYCLDAFSGTTQWSYDVGAEDDIYASPAVWGDMVYIPVRTNDRTIYALDITPEDGVDEGLPDPIASQYDIIWSHTISASKITSSPAVANGRVYFGAGWAYDWGDVYCLDAVGDGLGSTSEIWRYRTTDFIYGSIAVANGNIYVTNTDGLVMRFGALNGTDLLVKYEDISFSLPTPQYEGVQMTIEATISNLGNIGASNVAVRFFDDLNDNGEEDFGEQIGVDQVISTLPPYESRFVSVPWTADSYGYHNIYVVADPLDTISEIHEDNNEGWSFFAVEAPLTVDYIAIMDEPQGGGEWVGNRLYPVGASDTFFCGAFNFSGGFIMEVSAIWDSNDTGIATVTSPGTNTTFTVSETQWGAFEITATYDIFSNVTGSLTVIEPSVDNIIIRSQPGNSGSWVEDSIYGADSSDTFYCAAYNDTAGFLNDVSCDWTSSDPLKATVTTPGASTTFNTSNSSFGIVYVTADYLGLTNTTGNLTVLPPSLDYIMILDSSGEEGSEVGDRIYGVGDTDTFFCAGFNNTIGYIGEYIANWSVSDSDVGNVTASGTSTTFTASTSAWGDVTVSAEVLGLLDQTGLITVLEPVIDYLLIRDSAGDEGNEVGSSTYGLGDSDVFYCAGYNETSGFIDNVAASWSSTDPTVGQVSASGSSTTFHASSDNSGATTVTASFNGLQDTTGILTVSAPTMDYGKIVDINGDNIEGLELDLDSITSIYCAGYNHSVGFLGNLEVTWESTNFSVASVTGSGTEGTIQANDENVGQTLIKAIYQSNVIAMANVLVVDDVAPTAEAGEDQVVRAGDTVTFDGSASQDNLDIETYSWSFTVDGDPVTLEGATIDYEFEKAGTYEVTLTVTDESGNTDTDVLTITVEKEEESSFELWWIIALIMIVVVIVLILFFFLVTKKKKKGETEAPVPTSSQGASVTTMMIQCPSCKKSFNVQVAGSGLMNVTCPHCGTTGQMNF